jgi:aspartate/methionine/tyrosine aminotransferase
MFLPQPTDLDTYRFPEFQLQRRLAPIEQHVGIHMGGSGFPVTTLEEVLTPQEFRRLAQIPMAYGDIQGSEPLREALAALHSPTATAQHIQVTAGTQEANLLAAWALLRPGDEVLMPLPGYLQWASLAPVFGATFRAAASLDTLADAVGPNTRLIVLGHANNPTGQFLTEAAFAAVLAAAQRVQAYVLVDEVYRWATLAPDTAEPQCTFFGRAPHVLVTGGLSKATGLPGLRLGWLLAPPDVLAAAMARHDVTTIAPPVFSDWVAAQLLSNPDRLWAHCQRLAAPVRQNLAFFMDWLARQPASLGLHCQLPEAGAFAWLTFTAPRQASIEVVTQLLTHHDVLMLPGEDFGAAGALRIGLNAPAERQAHGLACLSAVLQRPNL